MTWRPISTAPKDGRTIIAIDADAPQPEATACAWHDLLEGALDMKGAGYWRIGDPWGLETDFSKPTHWMPMPVWTAAA